MAGIRIGISRGHFWLRIGDWRALWIKDVRRAEHVLFSDRYGSWHIGPFAIQVFGFPKSLWNLPAAKANARADRLMRWHPSRGGER